jgi:hypothetical protein
MGGEAVVVGEGRQWIEHLGRRRWESAGMIEDKA